MDKPKVIHVFPGYGGGISALLLNIVDYSADFVDHTLLSLSEKSVDPYKERLEPRGAKFIFANYPRRGGLRKYINRLEEIFSEENYDAVHCHVDGWRIIPIRMIAKKYGVKTFIVHAHKTLQDHPFDRNYFVTKFNRLVNCLFATNYMTCSQLAADYVFGKVYQKNRIAYLIPNGMNADLFKQQISKKDISDYKRMFGIKEGDFVIGHVGRLNNQKNHPFIFNIIKELVAKGKLVKVVLVGDGELKDQLETMIHNMGLTEHVVMAGRRSDIAQLMQFFDLMLLPSPREGLPTVAVECQAAGTPMFLSDTITKQCDMAVGLLRFLPLNLETWVEAILNDVPLKQEGIKCLSQIEKNGFTAKEAGKIYAKYIHQIITENKKL